MDFAADFTAIDFETANQRPDSACQLAAVRVREGRIVDSAMWMIRPKPFFFLRSNIQIHGITPNAVQDEPEFDDHWPQILPWLEDDCVVAHNAGFDIGVLVACLKTHGLSIPSLQYTCTRSIARRVWPNRYRFGLKPLSEWLGIRFRHHDALEDSVACAKVLLAAGIDTSATDLPDLERKIRLKRGLAGPKGIQCPGQRQRSKKRKQTSQQPSLPFHFPGPGSVEVNATKSETTERSLDFQRLLVRAELIRPLAGKRIAFRGRLRLISQQQAELITERSGGQCEPEPSEATSYLVIGNDCSIRETSASYQRVNVIGEKDFLSLLGEAQA